MKDITYAHINVARCEKFKDVVNTRSNLSGTGIHIKKIVFNCHNSSKEVKKKIILLFSINIFSLLTNS